MTAGIDRLSFYIPSFYLDLKTLASQQGLSETHFFEKTGQYKMAVPAPNEDIITMAANAAEKVLENEDKSQIYWLLFATETGIDQSKAAGLYIHHLLDLPSYCRVIELKQACYGATAGLQLAMDFLRSPLNKEKKALVIGSDIARYEIGSLPESSQGSGAVAMLLSQNPRILSIEAESGCYTEEAMDFWRPNYRQEALVNGKLSCDLYLKSIKASWKHYQAQSGRSFENHAGFCYHVPIPRLTERGHQKLAREAGIRLSQEETSQKMQEALKYAREIGNCYTASLYMSLAAWLDQQTNQNLSNQRVGLYSYGSGATAEYFSGIVQANYQDMLDISYHKTLIKNRNELNYKEYQEFRSYSAPQDGSYLACPKYPSGNFYLSHFDQHQRFYKRSPL
jgi:hydroxymethylglutaryl-CoA synthase